MKNDKVECRTLTTEFPNLVFTDGEPVCSIEIDTGTLFQKEQYMYGKLEHLIQTITAAWAKNNVYAEQGTIWQWGSPSVNFGHQSFSMFYAVIGMPKPFRKYLNTEIKTLKECVRVNSDYVVPNRDDGWDVLCHIEDCKVWEELDSSLWQEIKPTEELEVIEDKTVQDNVIVYKNAKMDTVYYDGDAAVEGDDCEVKIGNNEMIVSYEEGNGFTMYRGKELSQGHFELINVENNGKASLHMFSGSKILEGFWVEDGARGFWRIHLE